jgi:integrase
MKAMNFLTVKRIEKLLRRGEPGRHHDGLGLYLVIKGLRSAHWSRRYELHHKAHWMGLGSAFTFSLDEARARNRAASRQLADGIDPLQAKRAARAAQAAAAAKALTFKEAAQGYIAAHQGKWTGAHGLQWHATLGTYAYPILGALDVRDVDTPAILRVLEQRVPAFNDRPAGQFWTARAVTAGHVRNRIELVLAWAAARGHRAKENPAAWETLKHILPPARSLAKPQHYAAVPYVEVPHVYGELAKRTGSALQALKFVILCAARVGEVTGATWDEIKLDDPNGPVWLIAAARMKAGIEHRVPLSPQAVALLRSLYVEDGNPHIFIGVSNPQLSKNSLTEVMRRLGRSETVHGFRSSFSDWAHERTAHSNHAIELSLAHTIGSQVEKAYRRGDMFDKRRKLMEQWATFVSSPPVQAADSVVALRR